MDTIIVESKASSSGTAILADTKTMGKQMSDQWINANIEKMRTSKVDELVQAANLLKANPEKIRRKLNILRPDGTNIWHQTSKLPKSSFYE